MVFKNLSVLVLCTQVASALEGLRKLVSKPIYVCSKHNEFTNAFKEAYFTRKRNFLNPFMRIPKIFIFVSYPRSIICLIRNADR